MAVKLITPTSSLLATSTLTGRTAIVSGISGTYTPPYTPPVTPTPPGVPTTTKFADDVYEQLNLDEIVGGDEWVNLMPDPLFSNGIGAWTNGTAAQWTLARVNEQNLFGPYSLKATKIAAGANTVAAASPSLALLNGITYVASVYVYIPSSFSGTYVRVGNNNTLVNAILDNTHFGADLSVRNKWQRIWQVVTPDVGDTVGNPISILTDAANGSFIYIANPQLEVGGSPSPFSDNAIYAPAKVVTQNFLESIGIAFEQIEVLADATPQWKDLLDIDTIPDEGLAWFGQLSGTVVNPNLTPAQQRQQIRNLDGWSRGTPQAIVNAVRPLLTGTQTVNLVERDTNAYHFYIATYSGETPDSNLVNLTIANNKPAGLQYQYTIIAGLPGTSTTYANVYIDFGNYAAIYVQKQTYQDLYLHP
jgi:hypothetical protein